MKGFHTTLDEAGNRDSGGGGAAAALAVSTTYADLKALRDGGNLVPGTWYRITDYECTTTQENTQSAGHQFDIIVLALDNSHLSEEAYAAHHGDRAVAQEEQGQSNENVGDVPGEGEGEGSRSADYFADSKLEAWRLMYSLDNDTDRFGWAADGTGGAYVTISGKEGTIRLMRTAILENDTVWQYGEGRDIYYSAANPEAGDDLYSDQSLTSIVTQCTDAGTIEPVFGKGVIWRMIDEFDNDLPYDFKNIQFKRFEITSVKNGHNDNAYNNNGDHPVVGAWGLENPMVSVDTETAEWFYTFSSVNDGTVTDASLAFNINVVSGEGCGAGQNKMKSLKKGKLSLNNIVFIGTDGLVCFSNQFEHNCQNFTFENNNVMLTFGSRNFALTFGSENYNMTFGSGNYNMTFGSYNNRMTFGSENSGMTFGSGNSGMTFGSYNNRMTFGSDNGNMTFGSGNFALTFGSYNGNMTFGSGNYDMTFGSGNYGMTFGSGNYNLVFSDYTCNITVFDGVNNCTITGGVSASAYVKNAQIFNGTAGTDLNPLTIAFTANASYTQCAALDSNGTLKIWNPADLVQ